MKITKVFSNNDKFMLKKHNRQKKANLRRCILTHQIMHKDDLIRIVKQKDGTILINSNVPGKGAYISKKCADFNIIQTKWLLNKVFRTKVDVKIYQELIALLTKLSEEK